MSETSRTQVIIAGAGPTGLSLAAQLLRYNVDFIILEKKEAVTSLSKALVVQARTLEIFQEIGLAEKAVETGQITRGLNLFYHGKQRAKVDLSDLGNGQSQFPYALSLEQSKTEKLLFDHLEENNINIRWNTVFNHFEQNAKEVTAYYKDAGGQDHVVTADYLVGCDGSGSLVRHQLGLSFEGDTVPKLFYVADVKIESAAVNRKELFVFLIAKGFILFFPMKGEGNWRIVGILPDAKESDPLPQFTDMESYIKDQVAVPLEFTEVHWFSTYKVHSRKANAFMEGRCFIAGDAAHIHTPAGGQGMNTGIQDAYNLAWKIAGTLKGELKPRILESYNSERVGNALHLLETTDRMFDVMAGTNVFLDFLRLKIFPLFAGFISRSPLAKKLIFPLISQTGIAYPESVLTSESNIHKVSAGMRMPYFIFSGGKQIYNFLAEPRFKLLFFGEDEGQEPTRFNELKIKPVFHAFKEIPKDVFGDHTNFYVLLRPDNHISYIGSSIAKCMESLKKISI